MDFSFQSAYGPVPAKPPGSGWKRRGDTTQVMVRVSQWPDNIFRLWMPEKVGSLWDNWDSGMARQDFQRTGESGLSWSFQRSGKARVEVKLTPLESAVLIEARVVNTSSGEINDVGATSCLQLSLAPDFACGDLSRLFIRTGGEWSSLAALAPRSDYPHYFRPGRDTSAQMAAARGISELYEAIPADNPLMVCVSRDGDRSVGTASDDYHYLFHNRANPHLWCMHSQQSPVAVLGAGETASFRQKVYFVEGGLSACVSAYEADPMEG